MKLKSIVAAVATLAAFSAQATTTSWGAHNTSLEIGFGSATNAVIADMFTFSLGSQFSVDHNVTSFGAIAGATYSLYSYGADNTMGTTDDVGFGAWTFGNSTNVATTTLAAGSYYYSVFGMANGAANYVISSSITAAPVPEPETYALLGAGLGIIGFVASRRRRDF